jgi:hypothetical protein
VSLYWVQAEYKLSQAIADPHYTGLYLFVHLMALVKRTRRSGVLTLDLEVPLLSTLGGFRFGPNASITTKHQDIKTITSRRCRDSNPAGGAVLFDTWFWSSTDNQEPKVMIRMMAPSWWTPNILLGAINLSAKQHQRLVIYEDSFFAVSGCNECFTSIKFILVKPSQCNTAPPDGVRPCRRLLISCFKLK